jgi:hypothetical protein
MPIALTTIHIFLEAQCPLPVLEGRLRFTNEALLAAAFKRSSFSSRLDAYVIGSGEKLEISADIKNSGEDAFNAMLYLQVATPRNLGPET